MSNYNICLYREVKKKCTGCNLKTTGFLDCALIGVCAVIRLNMVCCGSQTHLARKCLAKALLMSTHEYPQHYVFTEKKEKI